VNFSAVNFSVGTGVKGHVADGFGEGADCGVQLRVQPVRAACL
jgi:hypothetical protein